METREQVIEKLKSQGFWNEETISQMNPNLVNAILDFFRLNKARCDAMIEKKEKDMYGFITEALSIQTESIKTQSVKVDLGIFKRPREVVQEKIKADSVLQNYINEQVLLALDAQKVATLICQQMTLVSLVREMRDAQKAYENAPKKTMEDIDALETYIFEMLEAEKKVDNLLKNIEEII